MHRSTLAASPCCWHRMRPSPATAGQHLNLTVEIDGPSAHLVLLAGRGRRSARHRTHHRPPTAGWCRTTCTASPTPEWWCPCRPRPETSSCRRHGPTESCSSPAAVGSRPCCRCCAPCAPRATTVRSVSCTTPGRPRTRPIAANWLRWPGAGAAWLHPIVRRRVDRTLDAAHLAAAMPDPEAVRLRAARAGRGRSRTLGKRRLESFLPTLFVAGYGISGGRITFADSGIDVEDDGRPLLDQAEGAGSTPPSGMPDGHLPHLHRRRLASAVRNSPPVRSPPPTRRTCRSACLAPVGDGTRTVTNQLTRREALMNPPVTLTPEQADAFGRELDAVRDRSAGRPGRRRDYIRRVIRPSGSWRWRSRLAGRRHPPPAWLAGTALLALSIQTPQHGRSGTTSCTASTSGPATRHRRRP